MAPEKDILDIEVVVLANLCVCYIMTNRNEMAEDLMRKIEDEVLLDVIESLNL